jgi:hypothetical protein
MAKVIEVMHRAGTLAEDADWQQQVDLSYLPR